MSQNIWHSKGRMPRHSFHFLEWTYVSLEYASIHLKLSCHGTHIVASVQAPKKARNNKAKDGKGSVSHFSKLNIGVKQQICPAAKTQLPKDSALEDKKFELGPHPTYVSWEILTPQMATKTLQRRQFITLRSNTGRVRAITRE